VVVGIVGACRRRRRWGARKEKVFSSWDRWSGSRVRECLHPVTCLAYRLAFSGLVNTVASVVVGLYPFSTPCYRAQCSLVAVGRPGDNQTNPEPSHQTCSGQVATLLLYRQATASPSQTFKASPNRSIRKINSTPWTPFRTHPQHTRMRLRMSRGEVRGC